MKIKGPGKFKKKKLLRFSGKSILLVGSGEGTFVHFCLTTGRLAAGVDIDFGKLKVAKERYSTLPLIQADACALPFKSNSFDTVALLDCLEHTDDTVAIKEAAQVARENILLTVPLEDSFSSPAIGLIFRGYLDRTHRQYYTVTKLAQKLRNAGLPEHKIEYFERIRPMLIYSQGVFPRWLLRAFDVILSLTVSKWKLCRNLFAHAMVSSSTDYAPVLENKIMAASKINCNLCQGNQANLFVQIGDTSYVRCQDCGLIYMNPRPERVDEINRSVMKEGLDYFTRKGFSEGHQKYYKEYLKKFRKYRKNNRLLEVGCASGGFLYAARSMDWEATGVEVFSDAATYGREKYGLDIIAGDLLEVDLPSGAFDVVIMNQVIEHLKLPLETLYKINKLLAPRGVVYIHTPNYDSLTLKRYRQFPKYYPKDHLYLFTDRTLKRMLEKTGFRVIWRTSHGFSFQRTSTENSMIKRRLLRLTENLIGLFIEPFGAGNRIRVLAKKQDELISAKRL